MALGNILAATGMSSFMVAVGAMFSVSTLRNFAKRLVTSEAVLAGTVALVMLPGSIIAWVGGRLSA
jgi:hypothetical protein